MLKTRRSIKEAVEQDGQLQSNYEVRNTLFSIITEADRSAITILLLG
ncbi:MAG: hypothetical protein JAZ17_04520 [Candidatus Thiodiazotropha endolucinida]|nr:hypothetical protein [Candidatus Thiodiazotropha endolucinida]